MASSRGNTSQVRRSSDDTDARRDALRSFGRSHRSVLVASGLWKLERLPCCRTFFASERLSPSTRERLHAADDWSDAISREWWAIPSVQTIGGQLRPLARRPAARLLRRLIDRSKRDCS